MRADVLLVARGLAPSRSAAQRLIDRGAVRWRLSRGVNTAWQAPRKAGDELPDACELTLVDDAELRWASRAGLKLDAALDRCAIDVRDQLCLDVGQSTGGFTDVLLSRGARHVVGVDVGHGQLLPRLRSDPRVTAIEGVNARHLAPQDLPAGPYALVVMDLSFISLTLVLPALMPFIDGEVLALVKPQFELQPSQIGKGGLVTDPAAPVLVRQRITQACDDHGLAVSDWFESAVAGGDGNQEHFARIRRNESPEGVAR